MLDRVGDLLMARAERSDVREEQTLCLEARSVLTNEGAKLIADFERHLRQLVDERMHGKVEAKADFATVDAKKLTLVDTSAMDESVLSGNIVRVVENQCESELRDFNRSVGLSARSPRSRNRRQSARAHDDRRGVHRRAARHSAATQRIKLTILKELNQTSLGDINEIYADLNRHLETAQGRAEAALADRQPCDAASAAAATARHGATRRRAEWR